MRQERRRYPRQLVSCPARVYVKGKLLVRGKTVDVSAGGVRVMGPTFAAPELGSAVSVEVDLLMPGSDKKRRVKRDATIRRVELMGEWTAVALEFVKLVDV